MTLSKFLQTLEKYYRGEAPTTGDYVRALFSVAVNEGKGEGIFPDVSLPQKLYNGNMPKIRKPTANKIVPYINKMRFINYLNELSIDSVDSMKSDFGYAANFDIDKFYEEIANKFFAYILGDTPQTLEELFEIVSVQPELMKHLLDGISDYQKKNIAVHTPQILLMLLTYPSGALKRELDECDVSHNYSVHLVEMIKTQCEELKGIYPYNGIDKLRECIMAAEKLQHEKGMSFVPENLLSYAVLVRPSQNINRLRIELGQDKFEKICKNLLDDVTPYGGSVNL